MKATYGFRATMTAHPRKGDELIDLPAPLIGEVQYQDEVPVGGTFRG